MDEQAYQEQKQSLQYELDNLERIKGQTAVDNNAFAYFTDTDNLIKWQLEVNDIIDTLYHLLMGDQVKIENGQRIWKPAKEGRAPLTEEGVQDVLRETYIYINKNLLLSYYDQKQIDARLYEFGDYFADLLMDTFEAIGMDDEQKQERYSLICLATVNAVNSAYHRALGGKERDSLTKKTMVHQSLNPAQGGTPQRKKFSLNPMKWFGGAK